MLSEEIPIMPILSRRRPLDEKALVAVLARLAAGEPLTRIAQSLGTTRSTLTQALLTQAWTRWVEDCGHAGLSRPEVL
jgi:hypothetical protein